MQKNTVVVLELYVARSVPSGWFVVIQSGSKLLKYFGLKITIKLCGKFIEYAWSNSQSIRWSYLSPKSIFENKFQKTNSSYAVLRFHLFQFEHKKMLNSSWNIYVRFDKLGGGYLISIQSGLISSVKEALMSCNILLHTQASFISLPRLYEFEAFLHKQSQKTLPWSDFLLLVRSCISHRNSFHLWNAPKSPQNKHFGIPNPSP